MARRIMFSVLALVSVFMILPLSAVAGDATVFVVQGVPGVSVDVALDGECAIENLSFADHYGPMSLAPDSYAVTVSVANPMSPCGGMPVGSANFTFADDENATIVAYLSGTGTPTIEKFENDVSRPAPGTSRIIAHHCAAAPAADISVQRDMDAMFLPTVSDLMNGDQVVEEFRPGDWFVSIAPAGSTDPAIGPTEVKLRPFMVYMLYAVGSVMDGSLRLVYFDYNAK
jgi:hypothetical protein